MSSTLDTLGTGNIHERADVGRQLSKTGTPDQIPRLLDAARADSSPGVRLYAICAVADILSRYRVGPQAALLSTAAREAILDQVKGIDPGFNAGVFSVMACLGLPHAARRILVGLRDPRLDVRTGATVGALRYFTSAAAAQENDLRAEVILLLDDARVRPDALARLSRLCARCGWQEARPALMRQTEREDQVAVAAAEALQWLDVAQDGTTLEGLWSSDGADATEVRAEPGPTLYWLITAAHRVQFDGDQAIITPCTRQGADRLVLADGKVIPLRRLTLPLPGQDRDVPALQVDERTWYRRGAAELAEILEPLLDGGTLSRMPSDVVDGLLDVLGDGVGRRLAARIEVMAGRYAAASARVTELLEGKRPSPELWFWLGEARQGLGDAEGARAAWAEFLERNTRRSPLIALAQQRLGVTGP